jgi:hypothetical protein
MGGEPKDYNAVVFVCETFMLLTCLVYVCNFTGYFDEGLLRPPISEARDELTFFST